MSHELFWLVMTTAMTGLMWVPYILDRIMVRGLMGSMANPGPADKPQSPWAQRLMAAHVNAVENLRDLCAAGAGDAGSQRQSRNSRDDIRLPALFLVAAGARVVYTLGIPVLRTLAFVGGFIAQVMLALALFKFSCCLEHDLFGKPAATFPDPDHGNIAT